MSRGTRQAANGSRRIDYYVAMTEPFDFNSLQPDVVSKADGVDAAGIARWQKAIIWLILARVVLLPAAFVVPAVAVALNGGQPLGDAGAAMGAVAVRAP